MYFIHVCIRQTFCVSDSRVLMRRTECQTLSLISFRLLVVVGGGECLYTILIRGKMTFTVVPNQQGLGVHVGNATVIFLVIRFRKRDAEDVRRRTLRRGRNNV